MHPTLSALAENFGLAMLGQALPKRPALRQYVRHAWLVVALGAATGLLAALLYALMLYGGFYLLVSNGLSMAAAAVVIGVILLLTLGITSLLTLRYIDRLTQVKDDLSLAPERPSAPEDNLTAFMTEKAAELLEAFWEGIQESTHKHDAPAAPHEKLARDSHEDTPLDEHTMHTPEHKNGRDCPYPM